LDELGNEVLPSYLMRLRWFGGKGRGLESVRIVDHANVPLEENSTYILLAEVSYRDGLPDLYQLPVAFAKGQPAYKLHANCPQSVIAELARNGEEGILYDAIYGLDFQQAIFKKMAGRHSLLQAGSELQFSGSRAVKTHAREHPEVRPRMLSGEQSNT